MGYVRDNPGFRHRDRIGMKAKARLRVGITPELRRNTLTAGLTRDRYRGNTIYLCLDRVTNKNIVTIISAVHCTV